MLRSGMRTKLALTLLGGVLCLTSAQAWGCKPMIHNLLKNYSGEVFLGKALSVKDEGSAGGSSQAKTLKIQFKVLHWLNANTVKQTVEVNGVVNSMAGTDCQGQFDFSAKVGETRVVFGQFAKDGSFQPDHFVYIAKEDKDKIPDWLYRAYFLNQFGD